VLMCCDDARLMIDRSAGLKTATGTEKAETRPSVGEVWGGLGLLTYLLQIRVRGTCG